jgi:hypothetical protein
VKVFVRNFALLAVSVTLALPENRSTAPSPDRPAPTTNPFSVGERLVYHVEWNPPWYLLFLPAMEAGEAELRLAGETLYEGTKAWKIVFEARSSGTLAKLAGVKVQDHFEFITDPQTLCTRAVSKKLREGKRKRDIDIVYYPASNRLHIREIDVAVTPAKVNRDEFIKEIPGCVRDLFSALYNARRTEAFNLGSRHRTLVGDNDKVKEIEVTVEKSEIVETPAGKYETRKLDTVALLGGLFRDGGQFKIWLTADPRRLPVQFEAKVNLGKVSGKLKRFTIDE